MVFPQPTELAILTVNGTKYQDWESVLVQHSIKDEPFYRCRFTCSEALPLTKNWSLMQIKPGDLCTVTLAGLPAFTGKVETRQVYYDAHRHHIEIQCATNAELATSAVIHPTMEWRDKTFKQIAEEVLGQLGIKLVIEGGSLPDIKFPRVSAMHSEVVHDFLDVLARSLSQSTGLPIAFTSNVNGDFVVSVGPASGSDEVIEGVNILIGREIIYNPSMAGSQPVVVQDSGNNVKRGAAITHKPYFSKEFETLGNKFVPSVIVHEGPPTSDKKVLEGRAATETGWLAEDQITVFATVYGWLRPSGGLWQRRQTVFVTSPMLIMNHEELTAKTVTFTQDNNTGTRTQLELCNANALSGLNPKIQNPKT